MMTPHAPTQEQPDAFTLVLLDVQKSLACGELAVPLLPDVAVRVIESGTQRAANAQGLAEVISADAALTRYLLRIAVSAAKRPVQHIVSLQHALAWLGIDEVANIAFTLGLQGKMLDVKGQQRKARRLWRHALASALWARQLACMLSLDTGVCYLCGLLHDIGKVVTLGVVHEVAQRRRMALSSDDYDRLVEAFHDEVGVQVVNSWALPAAVPGVIAGWRDPSAGSQQPESDLVDLAHLLADFTLHEATMLKCDEIIEAPCYRALGLTHAHAGALFDSAAPIDAELDRYLSP